MLRLASLLALLAASLAVLAGPAAARLSPVEQTWVKPLLEVYNGENANLGLVLDEERASNALIAGSGKNNTLLTETLGVFASCSAAVAKVGKPPTARLDTFYADMKASCVHLGAGAQDIAKAIGAVGKGNGTLAKKDLLASVPQLLDGSHRLAAAEKQLLAIGGKSIFSA